MALPSNLDQITASDPLLGPVMAELLLCLCEKADLAPNPPQHCSFRVGTQAPHDLGIDGDFCCEGLAYVTLGSLFPSSESFPERDIVRQADTGGCSPPTWGVELTASLVRCVPTGAGDGMMISNREWEIAALQNIYDTRTLQRTACCFRDYVTKQSSLLIGMSVIIGDITQGTPQGGCIERSVGLTVQIPNCDC